MSGKVVHAILRIVSAVTLANFFVFVLLAFYFGGDAINGYITDNHYYLKLYGRSTEVSKVVFNYSKWHAYSLFATFPLAIGVWYWADKKCKQA